MNPMYYGKDKTGKPTYDNIFMFTNSHYLFSHFNFSNYFIHQRLLPTFFNSIRSLLNQLIFLN